MLALRRLRTTPVSFLRSNTTVPTTTSTGTVDVIPPLPITSKTDSSSTPSSVKDAEPKVATTQGRRKREHIIKKRPNISLENPREWKRPIAYGVLPAYDEALRYLMKDSAALKKEAEELKIAIQQEAASEKDGDALEKQRQKLHVLEVQSEINLPEVRWKVANGMGE